MAMELTLARFIEERGVTAGFPYVKKKKMWHKIYVHVRLSALEYVLI